MPYYNPVIPLMFQKRIGSLLWGWFDADGVSGSRSRIFQHEQASARDRFPHLPAWEYSTKLCSLHHPGDPPCFLPTDFHPNSQLRDTVDIPTLVPRCPSLAFYQDYHQDSVAIAKKREAVVSELHSATPPSSFGMFSGAYPQTCPGPPIEELALLGSFKASDSPQIATPFVEPRSPRHLDLENGETKPLRIVKRRSPLRALTPDSHIDAAALSLGTIADERIIALFISELDAVKNLVQEYLDDMGST